MYGLQLSTQSKLMHPEGGNLGKYNIC